jgi:hypothetical protein
MPRTLLYGDLKGQSGQFLGHGRGAAFGEKAWDARKTAEIESCVQSGYFRVLKPPIVKGQTSAHNWSFLHPSGSVVTVSGQATVLLPSDFAGLEGAVGVEDGVALRQASEAMIRQMHSANTSATGAPIAFALTIDKSTTPMSVQRQRFYVYPTPDDAYTLTFTYYCLPDELSDAKPIPLGGPELSEVILQSCLAVAEERRDGVRGVQYMAFMEQLAAAISHDRNRQPANLGYNRDRSDLRGALFGRDKERVFRVQFE